MRIVDTLAIDGWNALLRRRPSVGPQKLHDATDLTSRFARAIDALLKLDRKNGEHERQSALPWYLLLGESRAGKKAVLQAAGVFSSLIPPATTKDGTQNCDWWISSRAVLLDTTGRYALPTDAEQDHGEWYELLRLLRQYRRPTPLHGVLLTVAADQLAISTTEELRASATTLRMRLDEAVRLLGCDMPVYLLVTKCDLLEGFTEFVEHLPGGRASEALGHIVDPPASCSEQRGEDVGRALTGGVESLVEQLYAIRLSLLAQDVAENVRQPLFCFPEEFSALQQPLSVFLESLQREDARYYRPFLRGVFFSSARQQGQPLSLLRRQCGLPEDVPVEEEPAAGEGNQSYFLKDVFEVMLPRDRHLAIPTATARRRRRWVQALGLTSIVSLGLLLPLFYAWAFPPDGRLVVKVKENEVEIEACGQTYDKVSSAEPLTIPNVRPGLCQVIARRRGYKEEERTIPVNAGEETFVEFALTPLPGSILVQISEDGSTVLVDGESRGQAGPKAPLRIAGLTPGQHTLVIEKEGYKRATRTITVSPGGETLENIELTSLRGSIRVRASEDGATVMVDGENRGQTGPGAPLPIPNLTPGKHVLVVEKEGYKPEKLTVTVQPETEKMVELKLVPVSLTPQADLPKPPSRKPPLPSCVRKAPEMPIPPGRYETIASTEVRLRPQVSSPSIETLEEGRTITVIGVCGEFVEVQPQTRPIERVYIPRADVQLVEPFRRLDKDEAFLRRQG